MLATVRTFLLATSLACGAALAQRPADGERPPRPDSASNAAVGGWCDALSGEKKAQCLRDERRRQELEGRSTRGSCDDLIGPDKERCVKRGGSIEVQARPDGASTGGTRRDH
jgi:hypothetical protein